jgi:ferritin-like metal-binding protein YciE
MTQSTRSGVNSKLVEYLNEMLSVENAAIDRIQSRIEECPIQEAKSRLQQHLQETRGQQGRLQEIISKYGGTPTNSKAHLSTPKPPSTELMKKTVKDTVKSVTGDTENPLPEEIELIKTKEDAILENAEIIGYKMIMQIAERTGAQDIIPILEQNMKEEQSMADWIVTHTPTMLDQLWPKIHATGTTTTTK